MLRAGSLVMVSEGSGIDSGKVGTVVSPSALRTDGRGVPTNVAGEYRPFNASTCSVVRLAGGNLIIMFDNRLHKLEE